MLKIKLIGIGAAGNKAAICALEQGVVSEREILLVNSNIGDIPESYRKYSLILSDRHQGTGKERHVARAMALEFLKSENSVLDDFVENADIVCVVNSSEGGTGSGTATVLYKYLTAVSGKNVMGFIFTGFEEDGRGLKNTVEFFKDTCEEVAIQIICNKKFLPLLGKNKIKAEMQANNEFVARLRTIAGRDLMDSHQNIDRTDLYKLVTTPGFMLVENIKLNPAPVNTDEFNQILLNAFAKSKSLSSTSSAKRIGVILSASEELLEVADYSFEAVTEYCGVPYEVFTHVQSPKGNVNTCSVIASGLDMPLAEVKEVYDRFESMVKKVARKNDDFTTGIRQMGDFGGDDFNIAEREGSTPEELLEKKKKFLNLFGR